MRGGDFYFKTEAGKQEIQDRGHRLPSSLRSLLLMVDGQRDQTQLRELMTGLHAPDDGLEQLVVLGLVKRSEPPSAPSLGPLPGEVAVPVEFGRYRRLYEIVTDTVRRHLGLKSISAAQGREDRVTRCWPCFLKSPPMTKARACLRHRWLPFPRRSSLTHPLARHHVACGHAVLSSLQRPSGSHIRIDHHLVSIVQGHPPAMSSCDSFAQRRVTNR